jgi:hypothetical protein
MASTCHGPHTFNIQNGVHGLQFSGMQKSTFFCICAYITTETECGYMDIGNSERRKLIFFLPKYQSRLVSCYFPRVPT